MQNLDFLAAFLHLLVFIPAVGLHEYCHAKFADMAGDMTPRSQGRVTLNPLAHLDPIGTIMVLISSVAGTGIGWGKPVMVNVGQMRNPRFDHFVSVVMGPISNLGQAIFYAILLRTGLVALDPELLTNARLALTSPASFASFWVLSSLMMNLGMFFFNMIPIGPLDGHWLVGAALPPIQRNAWYKFCHGPGMLIFLGLVLLPQSLPVQPLDWYFEHTFLPTLKFLIGL